MIISKSLQSQIHTKLQLNKYDFHRNGCSNCSNQLSPWSFSQDATYFIVIHPWFWSVDHTFHYNGEFQLLWHLLQFKPCGLKLKLVIDVLICTYPRCLKSTLVLDGSDCTIEIWTCHWCLKSIFVLDVWNLYLS